MRTKTHHEERRRTTARRSASSSDEWHRSLNIRLTWQTLEAGNLLRIVQLLNRSNQMNLRTRRLSVTELGEWVQRGHREVWSLSVADRFVSSGITGIVSLEFQENEALLVDFVLSCRVFGQGIERAMVAKAIQQARLGGARTLLANFLATDRNRPCYEFFVNSGLTQNHDEFSWDVFSSYSIPAYLDLEKGDVLRAPNSMSTLSA